MVMHSAHWAGHVEGGGMLRVGLCSKRYVKPRNDGGLGTLGNASGGVFNGLGLT